VWNVGLPVSGETVRAEERTKPLAGVSVDQAADEMGSQLGKFPRLLPLPCDITNMQVYFCRYSYWRRTHPTLSTRATGINLYKPLS